MSSMPIRIRRIRGVRRRSAVPARKNQGNARRRVMDQRRFARLAKLGFVLCLVASTATARADETCMSPYMPKITGQEDYVYIWTVGVDGLGDGSDKLVTVGANPKLPSYGKVVA